MEDRRDGFRAGVRRHGLVGQEYSAPGDDPAEIVAATRELLRGRNRPTAIVAGGDWLALGVYSAAREEGIEIGSGLALVAFDDLPVTRFLQPALTTVRLPLRQIAQALVARLLQTVEDGVAPQAGLLLPGELVIRPSLGA